MTTTTSSAPKGIPGVLSDVQKGTDSKGRTYLKGMFAYTDGKGVARTVRAMAFGKNVASMGAAFVDGPTHLTGRFDGGVFLALVKDTGLPATGHHRNQAVKGGHKVVWVEKRAA